MFKNPENFIKYKKLSKVGLYINLLLYLFVCLIIYSIKMDKLTYIAINLTKILSILILMLIIISKRFKINKLHLLWIVSLSGMILSFINSIDLKASTSYTVSYLIAVLFLIYFSNSLETSLKGINIQKYFCIIFMIFTIMPLIFKEAYFSIINFFFTDLSIPNIIISVNSGRYPGLGAFCGNDAFVISVGLGIVACAILEKEKFIFNIILGIMFSVSLLLTGSRAMFIASSISLLFVMYIRNSNNIRKIFKNIILILFFVTIIGIVVINLFPEAFNLFNRFENGNQSIDNRIILYKYAWKLFLDKPILGNGFNTFLSLTFANPSMVENTFAHNVILQLLAETGILGTVLIITPFFITWGKTVNILRKKIKYFNDKNIVKGLMISLYIQTIFIIYFLTGNPIYDYNILLTYFMFITIPININDRLRNNKYK